jgi:hypothetical protein
MSKQTTVEWLQEGLETILSHEQQMQVIGLFEQAKAMEREQIVDAYTECWMMGGGNGNHKVKEANEYYNKTFGGEE